MTETLEERLERWLTDDPASETGDVALYRDALTAIREKDRAIARLTGENKILRTQVETFAAGLLRATEALTETLGHL